MLLAAHQPNFCAWTPFFAKMEKCDVFVLMTHCNFEKNGFQNRFNYKDKWITIPVFNKTELIKDKMCVNGQKLTDISVPLIFGFARMLGIDTDKVHSDFLTTKEGTDRIIELCKRYNCNQYLTNPDAVNKYLDADKLKKSGIELVPFHFPYKKSLFEMIEENGIDGLTKIIRKDYSKVGV